jgi:hypothetical protein
MAWATNFAITIITIEGAAWMRSLVVPSPSKKGRNEASKLGVMRDA